MQPLKIEQTREFSAWFNAQAFRDQALISARINRLEEHAHLGDFKNLGHELYELRWKNGRRIYFTRFKYSLVLLILGGVKNAQKKDIKEARIILQRYKRA